MDSDDDLLEPTGGGSSRAAYAHEVQELSSDDEERGPILRTQASRPIDTTGTAGRSFAAQSSHAPSAAASGASTSVSGAPATAAADVEMAASDADEYESDDDDEEEEEDDDDDELGGNEGDRRFQAMLEQMQSGGADGAVAPEGDLLSQILKGGTSAWHGTKRTRGDEDGDEQKGGAATGAQTGSGTAAADSAGMRGSVGEDAVDYQIYCDSLLAPTPSAAASAEAHLRLAALRTAVLEFLSPVTSDHIWQKQGLQLQACTPHVHTTSTSAGVAATPAAHARPSRSVFSAAHAFAHSTLLAHLHGSTYFGDNIEDEWLIVYLLLTLSSHYPSLSMSLSDSDGSFLCIELAEALPEWLRPENSAHRVWLRRGQVHIVPVPQSPAQLATIPARPTVEQALTLLHSQAVPTAASSEVQQVLLAKLAPFFAAATATPSFTLASPALSASHYARIALPLPLALLLARYPQLLSEWAGNFFLRDAIDMKRGNKMERILGHSSNRRPTAPAAATTAAAPEQEEESKMTDADSAAGATATPAHPSTDGVVPFVFLRARFTHCLYAQLSHQRFSAPRSFSRHLSALTSRMGTGVSSAPGPLVALALDLGAKLATGAEMWYGNQKAEVARRANKARLARQKISASAAANSAPNPDLQRRDQAVRLASLLRGASLRSAAEVEAFLSAASAPSLVDPWRLFHASLNSLGLVTLASTSRGTSPDSLASDPRYWGGATASFLYAQFQPHHCVDQESVDELLRDPTLLPLFDPATACSAASGGGGDGVNAQERRVDSCINLPYVSRVLELMDQLCDACIALPASSAAPTDPTASAVTALPSSWQPVASALLRTNFASLPRDDSDDWLTLTPAQLDSMLAKAGAAESAAASAAGDEAGTGAGGGQMDRGGGGEYDGAAIVQSMHRFVGKLSEVEGVEAPKAAKTKPATTAAAATTTATAPAASTKSKGVSFAPDVQTKPKPSSSSFQPVSVDSDELMRLLSSVDVNAAQFSFAPQGGHGSFNRALTGTSKGASASALPASDSEGDDDEDSGDEDVLWGTGKSGSSGSTSSGARPRRHPALESDSDDDEKLSSLHPRDRPPTRKTTRPPENDPYAAAFGTGASRDAATVTQEDMDKLTAQTVQQEVEAEAKAKTKANAPPVAAARPAASISSKSAKPATAQSKPAATATAARSSSQPRLRDYMDAMDAELQQAGLQSDFVRDEDAAALAAGATSLPSSSSSSGPVNVDVNLLTNLLRSHDSESGQGWTHAGPVTSIMSSMGMRLPTPDRISERKQ